jgi:hypothetical protein
MRKGMQLTIGSVAFALLLTVEAVAQHGTPTPQPVSPTEQAQRQPAQPPLLAPEANKQQEYVAMVNGEGITPTELESQVQSTLQALRQQQPNEQQRPGPQEMQRLYQKVLENLIESRLVEQFVRENGPDVAAKEVDDVFKRVEQQLQTEGTNLKQYLAVQKQTPDDLRKRIEGSLAWQKFQQEQMTPEKLQRFYQAEKQRFGDASLEQVQPQVAQLFTAQLWEDVVNQAKSDAKIQVATPQGQGQTPQTPPQQPAIPPRQ